MIAPISERLTLAHIRKAAKDAPGIRMGGWEIGDSEKPLIEPLQVMADDIAKWFNPHQGWKLVDVSTGFTSPKRWEESSEQSSRRLRTTRAGANRPDQFTVVFHFDADIPPLTTVLFSREKRLDIQRVFRPEVRESVRTYEDGWGTADVFPTKIGNVYPLEQALRETTSPYYLAGVSVYVNKRDLDKVFLGGEEKRGQVKTEPATSLAVMVFMNDLIDYTRLEANRLRRIQGQLQKKFTTQAAQDGAYPQEEAF